MEMRGKVKEQEKMEHRTLCIIEVEEEKNERKKEDNNKGN